MGNIIKYHPEVIRVIPPRPSHQPRPRRQWLGWVLAGIVALILALVAMIPVRTYYYRDWLEARYYTTPLIVWLVERCYIVDPYGK